MNRRESLAAVAGIAATLSGCTGFGSSSSTASSSPTASERSVSGGPGSGALSDPTLLQRRSDGPRPPIWFGDQDRDDAGNPRASQRRRSLESTVIDTDSRANRISVADSVDRTQIDAFTSATEFGTETLYLEQAEIGECFTLTLCRIAWQSDQVSTDYARQTRSYTERCAVDQQVFEARLIRIPDAIDSDSVNSFSRSIGTASCGEDRMRAEAESGSGSGTIGEPTTSTAVNTNTTATGGDR